MAADAAMVFLAAAATTTMAVIGLFGLSLFPVSAAAITDAANSEWKGGITALLSYCSRKISLG